MPRGDRRRSPASGKDARTIGVDALSFLASRDDLLRRLLASTGLEVEHLGAETAQIDFFIGLLDFILSDDRDAHDFAGATGVGVVEAQAALDTLWAEARRWQWDTGRAWLTDPQMREVVSSNCSFMCLTATLRPLMERGRAAAETAQRQTAELHSRRLKAEMLRKRLAASVEGLRQECRRSEHFTGSA